ncbi:acyltransferase family protein [Nocardioides sp. Soil774]|uniref:acyltransferase family protein n=1 Tax=Nocardioides sp. Soil774 TaxID=1736408 RepID=UPI00138EC9BE|nr:acyltransferase [Nocardioides sp. Soil774]
MSNDKTPAVDFPALDVLRLVGALAVLTTHVAFQTGEYFRHGVLGTLLARMDVGVAVFFVLSGFLLSRPWWVSGEQRTSPPAVGRYALKRLLRIWPVYVLTACVALAVVPGNEGSGVGDWVSTAVLLDTYVDDTLPYGLTQMWSLSVEVAFYVTMPLMMWIATRRSRVRADVVLLVGLVLLSVLWIVTVAPAIDDARDWAPGLWLPGYLSWFAAGMWLARTHVRQAARRGRTPWIVTLGRQPGACWTAALGLVLLASTPVAGPVTLEPGTTGESVTKMLVYAAIGLVVVAAGVWSPSAGLFRRTASLRVLRHLGHVSYSIFCTHLIVLALLQEGIDYELFSGRFGWMWVVTLGLTLAVSELAYWLVERPGMSLARRGKRTDNAQHATAETVSTTK